MSITSLTFIGVYFPFLIVAYYNPIFRGNAARKLILLCASLGLYAFCEPVYFLLLLGMIALNYLLVLLSDRFKTNTFRATAIIIDALTLLFFKYINKCLSAFLVNGSYSQIIFPIGLSYFTFKAISYVVDSAKLKEKGSFIDVAIYISNFLTIVSGPLSTYEDELPSIKTKREPSLNQIYIGFERIALGLGKKIIIADSLASLVDYCFSTTNLSVVMSWAGGIAYTLMLFFDFSGYTDVAIGMGHIFGFDLPENFRYPYMATSIIDFWKRWHISLTKWFTKYIYIPIGGSRVNSSARHIFNIFVVWLVTGMWHGSNLTFIVWAMIYFVLQVIEKYTNFAMTLNRMHLGHLYVIIVVVLEWVIFKSNSIFDAANYIGSMFGINGGTLLASGDLSRISKYAFTLILSIVFSTNLGEILKEKVEKSKAAYVIYNILLLAIFTIAVVIAFSQGYSAPLYANF